MTYYQVTVMASDRLFVLVVEADNEIHAKRRGLEAFLRDPGNVERDYRAISCTRIHEEVFA